MSKPNKMKEKNLNPPQKTPKKNKKREMRQRPIFS